MEHVLVLFLSPQRNTLKQLGVRRVYNILRVSSFLREVEAGTEEEAMQECCLLLAFHGVLNLLYIQPRQAHRLRVALPTVGMAVPHQ